MEKRNGRQARPDKKNQRWPEVPVQMLVQLTTRVRDAFLPITKVPCAIDSMVCDKHQETKLGEDLDRAHPETQGLLSI
jgi:hypothetical protein